MEESDAALVARVRLGDAAAFEVLMRRHFRLAYVVALARVNNTADAEDICQEAFVSAWQHIHDCREPARFASWLTRIVRNTAHNRADYLRVREMEGIEMASTVPASEVSDNSVMRGELRTTLLAALAQLSPVQREVVLMYDLEGLSHAEIGGRLELSEGMSRRHLSDARKRLRGMLGDYHTTGRDND